MASTRRSLLAAAAAATLPLSRARAADDTIRIGVLTDLSGSYRDVTGPTSVACVRLAVAEFLATSPGFKVEVLEADHLNKADVGLSVARSWFDRDGVDAITDVGNSAVAIGLNNVATEKDKAQLVASAGTSDLTGKFCTPNMVHWTYDTWNLSHTIAAETVKAGGDRWFFITADYSFGKSIQENTTALLAPIGGRVVGAAVYPFPGTTDFSSYLLAAAASGANVIAFANAGDDLINCVKQAQEFGIARKGVRLLGMVGSVTAAIGAGLQTMGGVYFAEAYYWDLNDRTRAFMSRIAKQVPAGKLPNSVHAGNYAVTWHYLKAVRQIGVARARASGRAAIDAMKAMPTDDDCFGAGSIRADGRKIHPTYLWQVKTPAESKGPLDVYRLAGTTPAEEAFRPMNAGGCAFVRA